MAGAMRAAGLQLNYGLGTGSSSTPDPSFKGGVSEIRECLPPFGGKHSFVQVNGA